MLIFGHFQGVASVDKLNSHNKLPTLDCPAINRRSAGWGDRVHRLLPVERHSNEALELTANFVKERIRYLFNGTRLPPRQRFCVLAVAC